MKNGKQKKTPVIRSYLPKPEHEILHQELIQLLNRHGDDVSAVEMLAIAANVVGKLIAYQDQRTLTSEEAMAIVAENIEAGNKQVIEELSKAIIGSA